MKYEVRFSGSGGQGVITASVILGAAAALYDGKHVIQSQSYGPEARGGATKADVIIADGKIFYPKARTIDYLVSLTQKAADKFISSVKKGGVVIVDSDFVEVPPSPAYVLYRLPMTSNALTTFNRLTTLNVVSLGAFVEVSRIVDAEAVRKAVMTYSPRGFEEMNLSSFELGRELVRKTQRSEPHMAS